MYHWTALQSFQVEGPQNREISLIYWKHNREIFTGTFQGGKTARNSCYHVTRYINKTCSINRTSVTHIVTIYSQDTSAHIQKYEKPDLITIQLQLYCSSNLVLYKCVAFFNKSGDFHSKSGDREMFSIIYKIGISPAKSGDLEALAIAKS